MPDTRSNGGQKIVRSDAAPTLSRKRKLSVSAREIIAERGLPVWVRAPKSGPEHYTGASRAKLYEWAGKGYIRSVSIREAGQVRGCRWFHLRSILDFIARCEATANAEAKTQRAAAILPIALARLPYDFYTVLGLLVCAVAVCSALSVHNARRAGWLWVFGGMAIFFNPLLPIHLGRANWALIDVTTAVVLVVSAFTHSRPRGT